MLCRFARDILYPSIHIYFIVAFIHTQNLLFMMREIARDENFCRIFNQFYTNLCPFCFIYEWVHLNFLFHYYFEYTRKSCKYWNKKVRFLYKFYYVYSQHFSYKSEFLILQSCNFNAIRYEFDNDDDAFIILIKCKIIYLFKWNN